MKVIWKADFDGDEKDLKRLDEVTRETAKKAGFTSVEGPYLPQGAALMYIFEGPTYETLNRAGRNWLPAIQKAGLKVTPLSYEIAVTPDEFWHK